MQPGKKLNSSNSNSNNNKQTNLFFYLFRHGKDPHTLHNLAQKMEELIFNVADTNFFFNDLEDCDQVNLSDIRHTM